MNADSSTSDTTITHVERKLTKLRHGLQSAYSLPRRELVLFSLFLIMGMIGIFAVIVAITGGGHEFREVRNIPILNILAASMQTLGRIIIAYIFSVLCAVPLAIFTLRNARTEKIVVPLIDILQSIPILAFFPILVLLFVQFGFFNFTAIVIFFFTMMWTMTFNIIGGLKIIPREILSMAHVFHISKNQYLRKIILPAITPQLITSSIIAWSQGWNIAIVAEVLHTYLPTGMRVHDLPGVGTELVKATTSSNTLLFLITITVMIIIITIINVFVWQNLLSYAQRFTFE